MFASGGEDGTLRVWTLDAGEHEDVELPAQSCWCVAALPNGDVACGSRFVTSDIIGFFFFGWVFKSRSRFLFAIRLDKLSVDITVYICEHDD